jgi:GrpB-like predicted nucleotidyltransferase (UPF0157 family)
MTITLVERYNPEWPKQFVEIKKFLGEEIAKSCIRIEHVGSTSIPGMTAKPIIDLVLVIEKEKFAEIKALLEERGYLYEGDKGIKEREAFKLKDSITRGDLATHHLYVCDKNNEALRNHIAFREFLKSHKEYADKLATLKWELAEKYDNDRQLYIDGKATLCEEIMEKALEWNLRQAQ